MPSGTSDSAEETAALAQATSPTTASGGLQRTAGLSMEEGQPGSPRGRKVAILAADGVAADQVDALKQALKEAGAQGVVVGPHLGSLCDGVEATMTLANTSSVLFDAVYVPGGASSVQALMRKGDARVFVDEAYKHGKPIAAVAEGADFVTTSAIGDGVELVTTSAIGRMDAQQLAQHGIVVGQGGDLQDVVARFLPAIARHRYWGRPRLEQTPA